MIQLTVYGKPVAKQRPRRAQSGHFYTPKDTVQFEDRIAFAYISKYGKRKIPKDLYLKAYIGFYMKTCRADLDNLIKSTLDGFSPFFNDRAVKFIKAEIIENKEASECVDITIEAYRGKK